MSANVARRRDPALAAVYWTQMVERGAHYNKALCVSWHGSPGGHGR